MMFNYDTIFKLDITFSMILFQYYEVLPHIRLVSIFYPEKTSS